EALQLARQALGALPRFVHRQAQAHHAAADAAHGKALQRIAPVLAEAADAPQQAGGLAGQNHDVIHRHTSLRVSDPTATKNALRPGTRWSRARGEGHASRYHPVLRRRLAAPASAGESPAGGTGRGLTPLG